MEFDKTLKVGLLLVQPEPSAPAGGLVKAELAVGFVEGGAYIAVVLQSMSYHLVELVARMTVLGCCITDGNSFSRFHHRADVKRESVWMGLTESPNLIGNCCYAALLCRIIL